jgi:CubicO group peptidase (beta-lactamase class C family)
MKFFSLLATAALPLLAGEPKNLAEILEPIRAKNKLPACGVAIIDAGGIVALGVTGKRRIDRATEVTTNDLWHIGSCTKTMTAALVGMLVDEGKLRWDTPITEALPDFPAHEKWKRVTLDHLITQTSGIPGMTRNQWRSIEAGDGVPRAQREQFAKQILAVAPDRAPGKFAYSNSGYGLLGAVIERAANRSYEVLVRERIFAPLKITTGGFGAPGKTGEWNPSQPWGHYRNVDDLNPATPSPDNQFPPALSPAASVHMSLSDFAKFAWWVSANEPALVKPDTFKKLQTPPTGSAYAGGLWITELPGIGGAAVSHSGHMGGFFGVYHSGGKRACVTVFNTEGGGWEWLGDELAAAALNAAK